MHTNLCTYVCELHSFTEDPPNIDRVSDTREVKRDLCGDTNTYALLACMQRTLSTSGLCVINTAQYNVKYSRYRTPALYKLYPFGWRALRMTTILLDPY